MVLDADRKVGEVAAASLAAVEVFENFGIDYCCGGGKSIAAACREKSLESDAVLDALRHCAPAAKDAERDWNTAPLSELIDHIVSAHHEYLRTELPLLQTRLDTVYATYKSRDSGTLAPLPGLFFLMSDELDLHMQKEELMLFPAIQEMENDGSLFRFAEPIRVMLTEHDETAETLAEIRRFTRNYELPPYACGTYRALFHGFEALERDLHLHIHLENNILFPRALALEAHRC